MSSLKERVRRLEVDLCAVPMRHYIYNDLPFAIFVYPPDREWQMRREMKLLKTRLEDKSVRQVTFISLAELLWQAIDESEGMEPLAALERAEGFEAAQRQAQDYLSDPDWRPLPDLIQECLQVLDPVRDLVFIWRAGSLAPNIYRVSKLLDEMKGKTTVPCVLFMPATVEGTAGLRFMGITSTMPRGSYHTKVYLD
jgi:hypothetical protein